MLKMHSMRRPRTQMPFYFRHKSRRAAEVEMHSRRVVRHKLLDVQSLRRIAIIMMKPDGIHTWRKFAKKRSVFRSSRAIVQDVFGTSRFELRDHRHHWSDANPARQHQMQAGLLTRESEMIART